MTARIGFFLPSTIHYRSKPGCDGEHNLPLLPRLCRELVKSQVPAFPRRSPIQLIKPRTTFTNSRVAVSVREGFALLFERRGQLLDHPPIAGRVGRELRTPIETLVWQPNR